MPLFEQLERVKLRFISVCEALVARGSMTEADFERILMLLDDIDNLDEDEFMDQLRELSTGVIDFITWDEKNGEIR